MKVKHRVHPCRADMPGGRARGCLAREFARARRGALRDGDLRQDFPSTPIEQSQLIADAYAQDMSRMMRFGPYQCGGARG